MPISYGGDNITFADGSKTTSAYTGFKNRIINGGMVFDQRNAGASVTINAATNTYSLDRWNSIGQSADGVFTVQQNAGSVTPPAGFRNYLGATVTTADASVGATQIYSGAVQFIEGFNTADLNWGTANAQTVTLSFWVRSSLTGTFGGSLINNGGSRSYPFTYTISSANTWEQKSVTIAGDTSGTWNTTNGIGIGLYFSLGTGSTYRGTAGLWSSNLFLGATGETSVIGTNGATWYITGVQLEVGSSASTFDYRPYGTELALCQRYYVDLASTSDSVNPYRTVCFGTLYNTTSGSYTAQVPVRMRSLPSFSQTGGMYGYFGSSGSIITVSSFAGPYSMGGTIIEGDFTLSSSGVQGQTSMLKYNNTSTQRFAFSAEL